MTRQCFHFRGLDIGELGYGYYKRNFAIGHGKLESKCKVITFTPYFSAWLTNEELGFVCDYWTLGLTWTNILGRWIGADLIVGIGKLGL